MGVVVQVREGPEWLLGKVDLTGEDLPREALWKNVGFAVGIAANWRQILACVNNMEKVLRREGYLRVCSKSLRSFHEDTRTVDLAIDIKKGPQFVFGKLDFNGLSASDQNHALKLWKIQQGMPLNEPYIADYLRSVVQTLNTRVKTVGSELRVGRGTNVVDVVVTVR